MTPTNIKLPTPPRDVYWFGVERLQGTEMVRVEAPEYGGKWFRIDQHHPIDVLCAVAEAGTYRFVWCVKDRRNKPTSSLPFTLTPEALEDAAAEPAGDLDVDDSAPELDEVSEPDEDDEAPAPPPRTNHQQARANPHPPTAPQVTPVAAPRTPARRPAPRSRSPMQNLPDRAALQPIGQLTYLHGMAREDAERAHEQTLMSLQYMLETERIRSQDYAARIQAQAQRDVENTRAHYAQLDKGRQDLMTMTLAMITNQPKGPDPEVVDMKRVVEQLGDRIEDMAEDAEEITEHKLAQLSENPNDLERALTGFQNTLAVLANSPIGAALADRLAPGGAAVAAAQQSEDAAE